ncbi:biotin transporter BioY [Streptococcus sp. zg-JUN1979]|uniref:biotin transporter BioY n=1 Tax=Streptococcus sp. zg-JUN1979 TaxID=3391450 RepID=UPI0039A41ED6
MTNTYRLLIISLSTALLAVLSQFSIPIGTTPITLQTFAVGLIASLLYFSDAIAAVSLYLFLGIVGLPVFAGGSSGFASLISPSGGFLWGFLFYATITAILSRKTSLSIFLANIVGQISLFICGFLSLWIFGQFSPTASLGIILPFIPIELIKITLISLIAPRLLSALAKTRYFTNQKDF